jgi:hypothetical protein
MKSTKKMIDLSCSTGAENRPTGAGFEAIEPKMNKAKRFLDGMSSSIGLVRYADGKKGGLTGAAIKLAGFSLIASLSLFVVGCGSTNQTKGTSQNLSGDWSILFTVEPSGYSDPGNATLSVDQGGDITGNVTLTDEANDPGTFDVSGTVNGDTGAFTFSFTGTCYADDTDVTANLSGTVFGSSMNGEWTESASSGGLCEAGSGTFDGTSSASASYHSAVRKAQRAGNTHSDRVFMRGVIPRRTR